jgi:hypothetical protein
MDADDGCAMRQQFTAHGLVEVSARNVELPIRASLSPLERVEREVITGNAIGDLGRSSFNTAVRSDDRRSCAASGPNSKAAPLFPALQRIKSLVGISHELPSFDNGDGIRVREPV